MPDEKETVSTGSLVPEAMIKKNLFRNLHEVLKH